MGGPGYRDAWIDTWFGILPSRDTPTRQDLRALQPINALIWLRGRHDEVLQRPEEDLGLPGSIERDVAFDARALRRFGLDIVQGDLSVLPDVARAAKELMEAVEEKRMRRERSLGAIVRRFLGL